jgi:RNA polymerase primary sigma factor
VEDAADQVAGHHGALPDLLDAYLREIGHTSLLTPEQEIALAQRVERGDKEAADAMVQANLRLVVSVARRYLQRGLPLEDLIAEGNIGLLHAVQKYDWQRGYRFSTYAIWWIRQAISRAIGSQGQAIRVPAPGGDTLANRARLGGQRATACGRELTPDELDAIPGAEAAGVGAALVVARTPLSLHMAVAEDREEHLIDVLPDNEAVSPEDGAVGRLAAEEIRQVLTEALTARERAVLTLRFGLDGASPETLDGVGRRLDVTRERVRQIEAEALRKLRRPAVVAHLYAR